MYTYCSYCDNKSVDNNIMDTLYWRDGSIGVVCMCTKCIAQAGHPKYKVTTKVFVQD